MGPSDAKGRAERELDELEEVPPTAQLNAPDQVHLSKQTDAAKFERIRVSAVRKKHCASPHGFVTCHSLQRGLLANLSTQRISVTDIKFIESGPRNGGTFGDVAIATFSETTRHEQGVRLAVKKIRFVLDSDMTEEKLLKVGPFVFLHNFDMIDIRCLVVCQ